MHLENLGIPYDPMKPFSHPPLRQIDPWERQNGTPAQGPAQGAGCVVEVQGGSKGVNGSLKCGDLARDTRGLSGLVVFSSVLGLSCVLGHVAGSWASLCMVASQ